MKPEGLADAERAVLAAATRIVDSEPTRYPYLTRAVNELHRMMRGTVTPERFFERMMRLTPSVWPVNTLRRAGVGVDELMSTMTAYDVMDVRNAGVHCWAIWYLTCESFGVEPPWAAALRQISSSFREQVEHERARLRSASPEVIAS